MLCFCIGCSKQKTANNSGEFIEIQIDMKSIVHRQTNDFFQYKSFIVLETTDESIIQSVDKIYMNDRNIFIMDTRRNCILRFTDKGQFINLIDRKGQGPEEYLKIEDMHIDHATNEIHVFDGLSGSVLRYDSIGTFIDKKNVQKGYSFIATNDGNRILYQGNGAADFSSDKKYKNILIYDSDYKIINEAIPFNENMLGRRHTVASAKSVFTCYNNKIFVNPLLSNDIYIYDDVSKNLILKYRINFKGYEGKTISEKQNREEVNDLLQEIRQGEVPSYVSNFYEMRNFLFFNFIHKMGKGRLMCIFNKESGEVNLCDFIFDENGLFFNPTVYFSNKKEKLVLSILNEGDFEICKKNDESNKRLIEDITKSTGNTGDSNPILVFYKMK